ncbi:hypothetical protein OsI_32980 [Oryza sativa Indica Group]|uniref:Uncharacterized protein n=1 Tax=Oryza sativa subsp. indica TaxID=39946 RepID=B8BG26_ORYSI|nr:hypothetical protein OsI_32980 [Oryza sativa Indica Group]
MRISNPSAPLHAQTIAALNYVRCHRPSNRTPNRRQTPALNSTCNRCHRRSTSLNRGHRTAPLFKLKFGTVFIFLQSFWDKQRQFEKWMVSDEWKNSEWREEEDHAFTYDCLSNRRWWRDMELVLTAVRPIYIILRFADQQRNATISGFLPKMISVLGDIRANLCQKQNLRDRVLQVVNKRLRYLLNETLITAAAALDPRVLYTSNMGRQRNSRFAVTLALKKIARSSLEASNAIEQFNFFIAKRGLFGGDEARRSALNGRMSAVRNRLGYEKIHKLVYVHYNLKLRIQHFQNDMQLLDDMHSAQEREGDPFSIMIDVAMYDEGNPIMDWLCNSRSESVPILDEFDDNEPELSSPSRFLIEELEMNNEEVAQFKRKLHFDTSDANKKGKARLEDVEEDSAEDYVSDSPRGSPTYAESGDSSSSDGEANYDVDAVVDVGGEEDHAEPTARGAPVGEQPAPLRPKSTRKRKVSVKYGLI